MGLNVCPAATVAASIEYVWDLISNLARYGEWADVRVERIVPTGPAKPGQILYASSRGMGKRWPITLTVTAIDVHRHRIQMDVSLPLGLKLHQTTICTPLDTQSCHVQFG
jgi:hypothetical protein